MGAVVVPIIKVVGIALSAKSAYEGIKNGNLLQAVIGAVGAYYGLNSLASGVSATASEQGATTLAEGATQGAQTAGAEIGDQIAAEQLTTQGADLAGAAASESAKGGIIDLGSSIATGAGKQAGTEIGQSVAREAVGTGGAELAAGATGEIAKNAAQEAGKTVVDTSTGGIIDTLQQGAKSILDTINPNWQQQGTLASFVTKNPEITQGALQLAGGYAQGKAEEEMLDKAMKREDRLYEQRRNRMGTPGDVSIAASLYFNPQTRRFEMRGG